MSRMSSTEAKRPGIMFGRWGRVQMRRIGGVRALPHCMFFLQSSIGNMLVIYCLLSTVYVLCNYFDLHHFFVLHLSYAAIGLLESIR